MEHQRDGETNCNWCTWYSHQRIGTGTGRLENKRTSGDHPKKQQLWDFWRLEKTCCHLDSSEKPSVRNTDEKNSLSLSLIIIKPLKYPPSRNSGVRPLRTPRNLFRTSVRSVALQKEQWQTWGLCNPCMALDLASSLSRKLAYVPGPTFGFVKLLAASGSHCTKWADEQHRPAGFESRLVPSPPLYPHFNWSSGFWPCVKSCLVGGSDK